MHHRNSMPRVCSPRLQCTPPVLLNPPWTAARPRRGARIPRKCDLRGKQQGPAGFEIFNRPSGSAALFMFGPRCRALLRGPPRRAAPPACFQALLALPPKTVACSLPRCHWLRQQRAGDFERAAAVPRCWLAQPGRLSKKPPARPASSRRARSAHVCRLLGEGDDDHDDVHHDDDGGGARGHGIRSPHLNSFWIVVLCKFPPRPPSFSLCVGRMEGQAQASR